MTELFATTESAPDPAAEPGLWGDLPAAAPSSAGAPVYRVLARKYRPSTFSQLIGQEAMVRTLTNAIAAGRLPQAWMLTGVRGIGKTTTARIIARALNCTGVDGKGGPTITPCGTCDACRAIAEDRHVDVMEMDAASRTGVDDIRDIIDGVRYGPVSARYKIYILDEVHMLSKNAFNALLKTLEEPPPHTKFIFATTEIRKVPVTVLSRCQRFDLRRIDSAMLTQHFAGVAAQEQVEAEPEAVKLIARAADGSVRDGLSLLDQAIARGNGAVSAADVKDMLGLADRSHSMALAKHLLRGEIAQALGAFDVMQQAGGDPLQILQDMCELVHVATRAQVITDLAQSAELPELERQFLTDISDIKVAALSRVWQILLKGITEVQSAQHPAQAAEMVLIRLGYAAELPPPADLIKQLRDQLSSGASGAPSATPPSGGPRAMLGGGGVVAMARPVAAVASAIQTLPQPRTFREVAELFAAQREGTLSAELQSFVHLVRFEPGLLEIRVTPDASANLVHKVGQCLSQWTGQRWMVSVSSAEGEPTLSQQQRAAEQQRTDRINAHPLVQAVMNVFPNARQTQIRQKLAFVPAAVQDQADSDDTSFTFAEFEE